MKSINFIDLEFEISKFTTVDEHLQLAAELGKTLLERNKELETLLKEHKNTIDEQEQEIVYLKKHTAALREVNDSRLKVYEQLEVGIQDLERANHRLLVENTTDKKHIKTLSHNIETLEGRCDEFTKQLEECRQLVSMERRKNERLMQEKANVASSTSTTDGFGVRLRHVEPNQFTQHEGNANKQGFDANITLPENCSFALESSPSSMGGSDGSDGSDAQSKILDTNLMEQVGEDNEDFLKLVNSLEITKKAFVAEQQRCSELEDQLVAIIQENQSLHGRLAQTSTNEDMKSMHDELSILDEVRQGQMCSRCFRGIGDRATVNDEQSSIAPTEEGEDDDERSLLDMDSRDDNASEHSQIAYRSSVSIKVSPHVTDVLELGLSASPNPYRDLVEKYEALLEVQRSSMHCKNSMIIGADCNAGQDAKNGVDIGASGGTSLAEEFQLSGEYLNGQKLIMPNEFVARPTPDGSVAECSTGGDAASCCTETASSKATKSTRGGRTPTEFSEAETTSSGYSDETSNKGTQTDDRPGYFLCTIGDGDDCKFSIYDDASPIDSRFRNRPEYRELFKEIFAVLKKAAENKEEGDQLPLLDDTHPPAVIPSAKVPPVTPANEELPPMVDYGDDSQSIISSAVSEQSFAMSECITKLERKTAKKHIIEKNQENKPPSMDGSLSHLASPNTKQLMENGRVLTPLKREPLEYLSVGVGIKKKNRKKNRNFSTDRSESPLGLPSPPRFFVSSGKKRRDVRPYVQSPMASTPEQLAARNSRGAGAAKCEWNGSSMIIYNRSANSPQQAKHADQRGRELDFSSMEYRPSTVSQDLHKLKKLDLSYAEVLRRAVACTQHHHQPTHPNSQGHHHHPQQSRYRQRHHH